MRSLYTVLFFAVFTLAILFNKMLDNLMVIIYILAICLVTGLALKSLARKAHLKDLGYGLFYGSLGTAVLFAIGLIYLASAL